jgi:hypothetical protein
LLRSEGRAKAMAEHLREDRIPVAKPATFDGDSDQHTVDCERVLAMLSHGPDPRKDCVYPVGGLTRRYLVAARGPVASAQANLESAAHDFPPEIVDRWTAQFPKT